MCDLSQVIIDKLTLTDAAVDLIRTEPQLFQAHRPTAGFVVPVTEIDSSLETFQHSDASIKQ